LGDARLNRRLARLVEDLAAQPTASVPQACGTWAATKAAYRFWDSAQVSAAAIREAHQQGTVERLADHATVLVVQDTTNLDFTHHPATQGLGYLDRPPHQGLKVHSALAVSTAGVPLGLLHQEVWSRDPFTKGKHHQRRRREMAEKESQRWRDGLRVSQEVIPRPHTFIVVADREADIYELFAAPRRENGHLLIRATHNRRVDDVAGYLWAAIRQSPVRGQLTVALRRHDERPAREAHLTVRYMTLAIQRPRHGRRQPGPAELALQVILVEEEAPPATAEAICWLLLTTLPVDTLAQAGQCVYYYTLRWLVERYHYVLKSGCQVEELQLETAARIECALATYCIVAWRLLWLTYEARSNPELSADRVLAAPEWQSLYCTIHKTPTPPQTPPTLHQAVRWIAQLGGFLGRKSDGEPGVKVIWRGLRRLSDIAATWELAHQFPSQPAGTYG